RRRREVRALRIGWADADRLVSELDRQRIAIRLAVGDDGVDPERPAGAEDPQGDLAAVRDQDLPEHRSALPRGASHRLAGQLNDDELLAVLDGLAGLDEAGPDQAVDRRDDL